MNSREILKVIKGDYCVGCGTCAGCNKKISMEFNDNGQYQPVFKSKLSSNELNEASAVCPFTNIGPNEDKIAKKIFNKFGLKHDNSIGYYEQIYTGKVIDKKIYSKSSSGGIIRWLLSELISKKIVSKVIHVKSSKNGEPLFYFEEVDNIEDVLNGANSSYHPVEWSGVIDNIRNSNEKYAVVGVPCFIKSLLKYIEFYNIEKERVITIGLICGHLKSKYYSYMLSTQLGISHKLLKSINFRKKIYGAKANEKGVEVISFKDSNIKKKTSIVQNLFGTDYGFGLFKFKSCDFCDDVFAETADIVVGDAWLPRYLNEGRSLIVTRSKLLNSILQNAKKENEIDLTKLSLSEAKISQDAGLRHRKKAIAYRLFLEKNKNNWVPIKRIKPSSNKLTIREKLIQLFRIIAREKSTKHFKIFLKDGNYKKFERRLSLYYCFYCSLYGPLIIRPIKLIFAIFGINFGVISRRVKKLIKYLVKYRN